LNLEERDQSLSLLSQLYNDQIRKVAEAEAFAASETKARIELEGALKRSQSDDALRRESSSESLSRGRKKRDPEPKAVEAEPQPEGAKVQRRKSYVRKTRSKAEDPKLVWHFVFFFFSFSFEQYAPVSSPLPIETP
jgi:hypothetical protein